MWRGVEGCGGVWRVRVRLERVAASHVSMFTPLSHDVQACDFAVNLKVLTAFSKLTNFDLIKDCLRYFISMISDEWGTDAGSSGSDEETPRQTDFAAGGPVATDAQDMETFYVGEVDVGEDIEEGDLGSSVRVMTLPSADVLGLVFSDGDDDDDDDDGRAPADGDRGDRGPARADARDESPADAAPSDGAPAKGPRKRVGFSEVAVVRGRTVSGPQFQADGEADAPAGPPVDAPVAQADAPQDAPADAPGAEVHASEDAPAVEVDAPEDTDAPEHAPADAPVAEVTADVQRMSPTAEVDAPEQAPADAPVAEVTADAQRMSPTAEVDAPADAATAEADGLQAAPADAPVTEVTADAQRMSPANGADLPVSTETSGAADLRPEGPADGSVAPALALVDLLELQVPDAFPTNHSFDSHSSSIERMETSKSAASSSEASSEAESDVVETDIPPPSNFSALLTAVGPKGLLPCCPCALRTLFPHAVW